MEERVGPPSYPASRTTIFYVYALAIDPSTPATLYAGAANNYSGWGGVFKSTDGGNSWTGAPVLANADVYTLAD